MLCLPGPASLNDILMAAFEFFGQGNEGIDVKEGSSHCLIENNEVHMQKDEDSGGG